MPFALDKDSGYPLKTIDNGDGTHSLVVVLDANMVNSLAVSGQAGLTGAVTLSASGAVQLVQVGNDIVIYAPTAGGSSITWYQEAPSGAINGTNVNFSLANTPSQSYAVDLIQNGRTLAQGSPASSFDYSISGPLITMAVAPASGSVLWSKYY